MPAKKASSKVSEAAPAGREAEARRRDEAAVSAAERDLAGSPAAITDKSKTPVVTVTTDARGLKKSDSSAVGEMVTVRGADPARVGVWEIDPAHPEGEVFVSGSEPVEVARTSLVAAKISSGQLIEEK